VRQIPENAATVKPANAPAAKLAGENRALASSKKKTISTEAKETFTQVLEGIRNAKQSVGKNRKRVRLPGEEDLTAVLKRQITKKQAASKRRHTARFRSKSSGKTVSDTPSSTLAVHSAGAVKQASGEQRAATPISAKRKPVTNNTEGSVSGRGKTAAPILIGKDKHSFPGNSSGQAGRVEVVDAREMPSVSKAESPRKGESKRMRLEVATQLKQSADPIKGEHKFAAVETEIDITNRLEKPTGPRSAAADLSRKLDGQAGNDIVRQVRVVLSRADAGEVRINLRPNNLGRVRVQIHLEENRLIGRIFVESAAAREAFRNSLDGLHARLVESGFGAADLELAWDEGKGNLAWNGESAFPHRKESRSAAHEFESTANIVHGEVLGDALVNMVV